MFILVNRSTTQAGNILHNVFGALGESFVMLKQITQEMSSVLSQLGVGGYTFATRRQVQEINIILKYFRGLPVVVQT